MDKYKRQRYECYLKLDNINLNTLSLADYMILSNIKRGLYHNNYDMLSRDIDKFDDYNLYCYIREVLDILEIR